MTKTRVIRIRWARGTDSAAPALRWASSCAALRRDKPEWPQRGHFHHDPNAGTRCPQLDASLREGAWTKAALKTHALQTLARVTPSRGTTRGFTWLV